MPRKTRSEKILAKLRRLEREQTPSQPGEEVAPINQTTPSKIAYEFKAEEKQQQPAPIRTMAIDYSYVYKDLRKTAFFAAVAVLFEIVLRIFIFK
ncbi:MAG TPA: hypothetical protein VLE47_02585 [Candidatus Saccharimonadales bacterium]|nr:hypothetical protein [Candidatus Saccharimonadales bacterium]